jgi:hypothetical protein
MTINELIAAHWGDCDVQQGETPEAYAIRHEEMRTVMIQHRCWVLIDEGWVIFSLLDEPINISRTEGAQ